MLHRYSGTSSLLVPCCSHILVSISCLVLTMCPVDLSTLRYVMKVGGLRTLVIFAFFEETFCITGFVLGLH